MIVVVCIFLTILCVLFLFGVYQKTSNALCKSTKSLDGRTVVVTGGSAGMGLEIAVEMARRGAHVIITCPITEEGLAAKEQIINSSGNNNVEFKNLDLASLESTRRFAADIIQNEKRLDILVNNAGVAGPSERTTADGMNFVMQVNYFGMFLLTLLLLPLLTKTGIPGDPSRIVNTASVLHRLGIMNENLNAGFNFLKVDIYPRSKLCVVLFTRELAKRLKGKNVVANIVDPGAVGTGIFVNWDKIGTLELLLGQIIRWCCFYFFKTPWQGAQTALHVALDKDAGDVSGEYFENCHLSRAARKAYDENLAKKLWEQSEKLVKL